MPFVGWFMRCLDLLSSFVGWVLRCLFASSVKMEGGMEVSMEGGVLAEGGFSVIYGGVDQATGLRVAVKELRCVEREQCLRAEREMAAHRRVRHARVMPLLDSGVVPLSGGGAIYRLVFPRCASSLREELDARVVRRDAAPFPPETVATLLLDVAEGLRALHGAGLAHRDVKPENVLLDGRGRGVLMDLGSCAETPAGASLEDRRAALALMDEAATHSTMSYRAPELWAPSAGDAVDGKADVWSLGCVAWALAYGYSPFESEVSADGAVDFVESSHLRALSTPKEPSRDLPQTRHAPSFYAKLERIARRLFEPDATKRPNIQEAISLVLDLSAGQGHVHPPGGESA